MPDAAILSFSIQVEVERHEQPAQLLILAQLLLGLAHHQLLQTVVAPEGDVHHSDRNGELLQPARLLAQLRHFLLDLGVVVQDAVVLALQVRDRLLHSFRLAQLGQLLLHLIVARVQQRVQLLIGAGHRLELVVLLQQLVRLVRGLLEFLDEPEAVFADLVYLFSVVSAALHDLVAFDKRLLGLRASLQHFFLHVVVLLVELEQHQVHLEHGHLF